MSEEIDGAPAVSPAARASSAPMKGISKNDSCVVDLTLSDSDDNAPPPASTTHKGSYAIFSKYGQSLRPRKIKQEKIPQKRPAAAEDEPKVVTPSAKKKKPTISSGSDCSVSSSTNELDDGAIGYAFHKRMTVGIGNNEKTEIFHGEVVEILGKDFAKNGKDRRVVYNHNETEYLSITDLQSHFKCLNKNCPKKLSAKSPTGASPDSDDESLFPSSDECHPDSDDESLFPSSDEGDDTTSNAGHAEDNSPEDKANSDDDSLFPSSEQEEGAEVQFNEDNGGNPYTGNPDDDNESTCSRFSDVSENAFGDNNTDMPFSQGQSHLKRKPKKKLKIHMAKSLVTDYEAPPEKRYEREAYYFAIQWGKRMQKERISAKGNSPKAAYRDNGVKYRILFSNYMPRKGQGPTDDRMSNTYKSYYLGVSGHGIEKINLKSALLSIADFESLTYDHGAHKTVSRLDLLVSPACRTPATETDKEQTFCVHRLEEDQFEQISDHGHLGCGFIPPDLLVELLGSSTAAQRKFAIQVRIIGPRGIGIAKGMLFAKDGIDRIQIPASMIKVNKSRSSKPLHVDVVLVVIGCFPSENQWLMGRLFDDSEKNPTDKQISGLKMPCKDVLRVLRCKGVEEEVLEQYVEIDKRLNHANLVGVIDPTGTIPHGKVFLTGMGHKAPSRVFLTRNPCCEGKDGIVVEVASYGNIPEEAFALLNEQGFGAIVFALGDDPLPPKINDGDLDGDLFMAIWDTDILDGININSADIVLPEILTDDLIGTGFKYKIDGKTHPSEVVQKIQENPDLYSVQIGEASNRFVLMTREEILGDKDSISQVVDHRSSKGADHKSKRKTKSSTVEFNCKWHSGKSEWLTSSTIRKTFALPPPALLDYVTSKGLLRNNLLPKDFSPWIGAELGEEDITEILNHRTNSNGTVEVLCQYTDNDEIWLPVGEVREDCRIFLGAYARKHDLFSQPGWEKSDGYWLEEVHDLMCNQKRSTEIDTLFKRFYKEYKEAFDTFGGNHEETLIWGRAYKDSLEIGKHGGVIALPYHLSCKLSTKLRKFVKIM